MMLKIGWSSRDFTPTRSALLQGQMHVRIARTALDPPHSNGVYYGRCQV